MDWNKVLNKWRFLKGPKKIVKRKLKFVLKNNKLEKKNEKYDICGI